jgi:hypothetical protein
MDEGPYTAAWRSHRRWSIAFWLAFLCFVPAVAMVDRFFRTHPGHGNPSILFAFAWMGAFAVTGYRQSNFACPRCGELFFRRFDARPWRQDWQYNPFARHCMHCGLRKGAPSGE